MDRVDAVEQRGHRNVPDNFVNIFKCIPVDDASAPVAGVDIGVRLEQQIGVGLRRTGAADQIEIAVDPGATELHRQVILDLAGDEDEPAALHGTFIRAAPARIFADPVVDQIAHQPLGAGEQHRIFDRVGDQRLEFRRSVRIILRRSPR